jgi:endonuclease V-like protein UPF0215 family
MSAAAKAARIEFGDMNAQVSNLRQQWKPEQVRIIILSGVEIGWLQSQWVAHSL